MTDHVEISFADGTARLRYRPKDKAVEILVGVEGELAYSADFTIEGLDDATERFHRIAEVADLEWEEDEEA